MNITMFVNTVFQALQLEMRMQYEVDACLFYMWKNHIFKTKIPKK